MNNLNIEKLDSDIIPFINNEDVHNELNNLNKISQPYLTKYEYAKIIGIAAQQQIVASNSINSLMTKLTLYFLISNFKLRY